MHLPRSHPWCMIQASNGGVVWDDALPSSQSLSSFFRAGMHGFEAGVSGRGNAVARGTCRPLVNMSEYENGYNSVPGPALDHFGMFRAFSVLSAGGFGRWTAGEPRNTNPVSGLGFHVSWMAWHYFSRSLPPTLASLQTVQLLRSYRTSKEMDSSCR